MSDLGSDIEPLAQTIRLRGVPFSTTAIEVEEWLIDKGVRVLRDGVELELGANGRPTGQAFAEVESPEEVDVALRLHGQHMGPRYIEVFEATPRTAAGKGLQSSRVVPQRSSTAVVPSVRGRPISMAPASSSVADCVVRLRGLPFDATENDVAAFLRGVAIQPHGVHLVYDADDRPSGLAYVEVATMADVDDCLARDQRRIGHRYIEVFRSSFAEMSTGGKVPSPERSFAGTPIGKGKGFKGNAPSHRGADRGAARSSGSSTFHPYGAPITRGRR